MYPIGPSAYWHKPALFRFTLDNKRRDAIVRLRNRVYQNIHNLAHSHSLHIFHRSAEQLT